MYKPARVPSVPDIGVTEGAGREKVGEGWPASQRGQGMVSVEVWSKALRKPRILVASCCPLVCLSCPPLPLLPLPPFKQVALPRSF